MKTRTKRIISTLAICGALLLEAGATAIGSLGKALNNIAKVDAATPVTVTYAQTSTTAASVSTGTAPTGSSVDFNNTYSTKDQLTKNNSMTFTLKGYAGHKITALSMSMHSNKSAGTGKFSLVAGSTTLAEIASNTGFNQSAWYGSWTQDYVTVTPTMSNTSYEIKNGENVVLTISASANSLFCQSITLTYEKVGDTPTTGYTVAYDGNGNTGGSVPTDSTSYSSGASVTVKDNTGSLVKTGFTFDGWNTQADGKGTNYSAGSTFNIVANTTLYANWKSSGGGTEEQIIIDATTLNLNSDGVTSETSYGGYTFAPGGSSNKVKSYGGDNRKNNFSDNGAILIGKKGAYLYNTAGFAQKAVKFEMYWNIGGSTAGTLSLGIQFSDSPLTSYSTGTNTYTNSGALTQDSVYDLSSYLTSNCKYFYLKVNSDHNAQVQFRVTLEKAETKTVTSIAVKTAPSKTTYYEGETFNPAGLVITATYDDESTADIAYADHTGDFTFSPSGSLATTDNKVTITYKEKTVDQAITVNSDTLNSITLGGSVTGTVSSGWDLSGVTVTGNYVSGSRLITDATPTTSTPAPTEFKQYTVNVSVTYKGVTANNDYTVDVKRTGKSADDPLLASDAMELSSGEYFVEGVVAKVSGSYSSDYGNKNVFVTDDGSYSSDKECFEFYRLKWINGEKMTQEQFDSIVVGSKIVAKGTITTYSGQKEFAEGCQLVSLANKEVSSIAVTTNPTNSQYSDKAFDKTGMVVTATYDDASTADVTNSVVIEPSTLASTTTSVTIKYTEGEKTVQTNLTVDVLTLNKITAEGQTTKFRDGDTFTFDGNVYPWYTHSSGATESKGSALASTEFTVSNLGKLTRGNAQEVVITHTASTKTCSYTIDVDYAYVASVSMESPIKLGIGGTATFNATVLPDNADKSVVYSIDEDQTTLDDSEYTLSGNVLTIADDIAESGEVYVIATTVGKDSDGQSKTTSCKVEVTKAVIAQIVDVEVTGSVSQIEQYAGKDFNYNGLEFTPVWSEGDHDEVVITGDDIEWPALTNGMTSIKGQYDTGSSKLDVEVSGFTVVEDYLKSIAITGDMSKKEYYSNAKDWDFSGLVVTGKNASGDDATIVQANVEYTADLTPAEYLSTEAEKLVVTATYGEKTDTIDITGIVVNEYKLNKIEVTSNPSKVEYIIGEAFDSTGLVVKATFSDGSTDTAFTNYTLDDSAIDMYAAGNYSVKVQADGVADVSFNVKYGVVTPQEGFDYWQKVTSDQTDWSGEYLLVYEVTDTTGTTAYVWTGIDNVNCYKTAEATNNKIASIPDGSASITLEKYTDGYSVKVNGGDNNGKYIYGSSGSNTINFGSDPVENSVSFDTSSNYASITANTYLTFNSASNQMRFRYMKSDSKNVQLYKHVSQPAVTSEAIKFDVEGPTSAFIGQTLTVDDLTNKSVLFNDGTTDISNAVFKINDADSITVDENTPIVVSCKAKNGTKDALTKTLTIERVNPSVTLTKDGSATSDFTISETSATYGSDFEATISSVSGATKVTGISVKMNGVTLVDNDDYTFENGVLRILEVTGNIEVDITSAETQKYTVTLTEGKRGSVTLTNKDPVEHGASYSATISLNPGYQLNAHKITVKMGGTDITSTAYTEATGAIYIESVTGNIEVIADSSHVLYTINYSGFGEGTKHAATDPVLYTISDKVEITPKLEEHYKDLTVIVYIGGVDKTSEVYKDGVITLQNCMGDVTFNVSATRITYDVSFDYDDTKITPSSTENKAAEGLPYSNGFSFDEFRYEIDRDLTEITMENKGGALIDLSDKGVLTISEVTGDISIKIVLKNKMYPVVTDDSVGGYTINPGQIDALGNATINLTLKDHYNFDGITTISATVAGSEKSYTLEGNPTDGYKITIPQEDIIDSIVLTTDANHENCTLSATTIGVNGAIIENPKTYNTAIDYTFVIKEGFDPSTLNVNLTCYGETFTDFELANIEGTYHIKFTIKGHTDIFIDAKAKVNNNFTPENMISNSNVDPTAIAGGFYTGTLTFIEGYDPDKTTVKIEMRDDLGEFQDITNSAYTVASGVIYIENVTGEIKITASTQLKVFDVTFDGDTSNYTPSIVPTDITYGNPCGTVIAPNTGYKLTSVTYVMGDADPVTVTIGEDGKAEIDIEKVIGDIVITATTEALPMDVVIVSGDVTADKTTVDYDEENVFIKVTADTGYHLTSLKFTNNDGEAIIVDIGEDKSYAYLSVDKVKGNIKIYAETEINEYTLTVTGNNLLDDSYATVVADIDGKPVSLSSGSITVKHFQEGVKIIITLKDGKRLVLPVEGSYDNPVYSMNGSTDGLTWSSQYNTLTIDTVTGDISFRCDIEKIPVDAAYTFDVTVIENKVGPSVIYQGEEVTYEFKIKDELVKKYQFDKENSYVKTYVDGVLTDIKDETFVWNYDESTGILYVVVSEPNTLVDIKIAHEYIEYTITSSESELYYIEVPEEIHFGDEDVEVNIVPDDHCSITEVKVYLDGALIESGYTYSNNVVTIASIEGDYLIDATVVHDDVTVVLDPALSTDISFSINDPQEKYPYGTKIIGTFTPAPNFELPSEIEVFVYDSDTALNPEDYVYNSSSGYFEITANGDIRIVAHGSQGKVNIYYTVDEHSSLSPAFDSGILVDKGSALSLTVNVEKGYVVDYVTVVVKQGTDPIEKAFNPYENTIYLNSVTDNVYITVVTKVAVQSITYDIVNATAKAGDQNPPATINYGGELVVNVSAVNGYTLDGATVKVVIDGTRDITATAYSNGVITIDKVDGDVAITVIAKPIPQVIDYPSAYVDFTNKPESVNFNDSFKTTFNIQSGYELDDTDGIVITMAGVDITDSALDDQTISIEHVTGEVKIIFNMHAITYPVDTSSVDEKITIVGNVEEVTHGESYVVKLVADDHYHITSVTVEMAGVDITDLVFVDGVININAVTGDITITAEVEADVYTIDNSGLTNVTNNNSATSVNYDDSYEATLSPADGYFDVKFTITMGGVVVDCTGNTISIEHVTGDIVIKASATKIVAVDIIATLDDAFKVVDFDSEFPIDSVTVVLLNNDGSTTPYLGEISFDGYNKAEYGVQTVTIIAGTFTDTVEIEVLKSLVVDQVTDVSTYEASYDFGYDLTIADIIVFYDTTDGLSHSDAPDSIVDGTYDITKSGDQHVKVMFDGSQYEVVVHINASTEVESISAVVASGKEELEYGDPFTVNDVVVTAKYTDGNTETVDAELVVFKGTPGANVVVVLAKGKTCTVSVTVKASTVIDSISAGAKEESYAYGTTLTIDDFTVTATYTDGHTGTVTATSVDAITLVPGFNVVTVRVNDKSCQVVVKVNDSTVVDSIKAVIKDGKDVVAYDGAFTKDDVVVYATYTDHQTKVVTDFEMTGFDGKHIGVNTVTISFGGKTCTVKVTVLESTNVDHIVATATKDNLTYGDTFTKEDVKVTQVYTDGHEVKDLTPDSITGFTGVPGDNKVTVSLGGKTVDIHVTVKQSEVIQSIEASVNEGRDVLEYKEPFTVDDVTVVATYTDGHTAVVAADSVDFAGTVGENTVVVHVGELTDNVTVTVKESTVIIGIEATTEKSNVEYGGTFTKDDVKASYVYEDGHKVAATVDSIEGFNATQLGKQTITVHVGEYTTTLEITVSGRVVLSIEAIGYNDSVDQGREYTFGGKVIAHYNDGTSEEVTGYTVDKVDTSGHGPQTVKVTYEGVSTSFTISVIQTKGDLEPYQSVAIISGAVIGVSAIAVGIFFLLKKFKI